MACSRFLNFEPMDRPSWRKIRDKDAIVPSVSEMIMQIIKYKNIWKEIQQKAKGNENIKNFNAVQQEMYLKFLYQIQIGEEIGVLQRKHFKNIICDEVNKIDKERGKKRVHSPQDSPNKKIKRWPLVDHSNNIVEESHEEETLQKSTQDRGDSSNTEESQNGGSLNSTDSLPSSLDAEIYIEENSEANCNMKTTETINLLRGHRHLRNELHKIPKDEWSDYLGIIDVEMCIKRCHEILMKDLMERHRTVPGKFSTLPRTTEYRGTQYFYPSYKTEDVAYDAVQAIVDQYNRMIGEIAHIKSEREKLTHSFKCAAVLLFGFLTLHPFSDGNGRLARLLCNHCLKVFCPFPTAIYNVFSPSTRDDYLDAIVNVRKRFELSPDRLEISNDAIQEALLILEQKPAELCSLIIESNWFTWRYFLRKIGVYIPKLDFEQ